MALCPLEPWPRAVVSRLECGGQVVEPDAALVQVLKIAMKKIKISALTP
jgi:hypothetical protein